ncbi:BQ5605_C009g05603 [Microbotryum silenes-dioicae]|uniref:BQ5605_C009g05603 protein n=1 Tax=Microbotryum silenes-dioicae TaxID=796604 RepID=A0A2X0MGW4_9BASI|nr:BQ5605_C009g05603 [Microbotryum silenes-dioicae]
MRGESCIGTNQKYGGSTKEREENAFGGLYVDNLAVVEHDRNLGLNRLVLALGVIKSFQTDRRKRYDVEERADTLAEVGPPHRLGQDVTDVDLAQLRTPFAVRPLRDRVGHDQPLDLALPEHLQRRTGQDSVRDQSEHGLGPTREQMLGRERERTARVGHVVDQDRGLTLDVADEHHARDLVRLFAFLVEQRKVEVERSGHGRRTLGATGVGGDDHGVADLLAHCLAEVLQHR